MKLVPSILLAVFVFFTAFNMMGGHADALALLKTAGPLGGAAFAVGYAVDILIFVALTKSTIGRSNKETKKAD